MPEGAVAVKPNENALIAQSGMIPDEAADARVGITGMTGSGKSTTAKGAVENILRAQRRVCIVDLTDVWWGLRLKRDGKTPAFPIAICGGSHGDIVLNEHAGALLGQSVAQSHESVIVSLSEFDSDAARRRFALDFFTALHRYNRAPLHLIIDEADFYAPQQPVKEGPGPLLLNRVKEISSRGRVRGFRCWYITQRPAKLHKDVLSQAETLISMQLTASQDRDAIERWIGDQADVKTGKEILASLPRLQKGQGVMWAPRLGVLQVTNFAMPETFDSMRTPEYGEKIADVELVPLDISSLKERLSVIEVEAKKNDPAILRKENADLRRQLAAKPAAAPVVDHAALDTEYRRGVEDGQKVGHAAGFTLAIDQFGKSVYGVLLAAKTAIEGGFAQIDEFRKAAVPQAPALTFKSTAATPRPTARPITPPRAAAGPGEDLPKGERACLTAIAQHPTGVTRVQLTVMTGYKRSSRDTYIQRLRERGHIAEAGERITATDAGVAALGSDFEPLPTGAELRAYHLQRLPEGERRVLQVLIDVYPDAVDRDEISRVTDYKRSSRDTYLQRLSARELVVSTREGVKASEDLF